ncbi:isocitrate lyase/phosphoenolpyruvate mutase family protein [Streptomyces sp. NPDC058293]|uniref:isocitrate lyase/phosphoenolpyruvate mutase family protein n=1 Tax=Streptomyces sp. NPDC058293 TaxID=3346429 RepID=UPI0036E635EE
MPVNGDFEDGYGDTPEDVAATVEAAVESGLAGIGVEDTSGDPDMPIRDFDEAVSRVRSAVDASKGRIRDFLNLRNYGYKDLNHWMEKQTYLAMGLTMMAAAELGGEAMPLEGFDPTSVDKAFKIRETGHTTTVLLALGYPDPEKVYNSPISRFETDQLFTFV